MDPWEIWGCASNMYASLRCSTECIIAGKVFFPSLNLIVKNVSWQSSVSCEAHKHYCNGECLTFHNNINISLSFHGNGIKLFALAKAEKLCTWHERDSSRMDGPRSRDMELIIYVTRVSRILTPSRASLPGRQNLKRLLKAFVELSPWAFHFSLLVW